MPSVLRTRPAPLGVHRRQLMHLFVAASMLAGVSTLVDWGATRVAAQDRVLPLPAVYEPPAAGYSQARWIPAEETNRFARSSASQADSAPPGASAMYNRGGPPPMPASPRDATSPDDSPQPRPAVGFVAENACSDCYDWQLVPKGLIYRSYLAGAKEPRFRSVWNQDRDDGKIWDVTLGGRVGLLRYGTTGEQRPEGFQLDIEGAGLVRLDWEHNRDVQAVDFRFGVPLTWGNEHHQVKFGYYHLSSHVGDEFLIDNPTFVRLNYSRDVLVLGYSHYVNECLRLYGEAGWSFYDEISEQWEFQFGVDYAPGQPTGRRGAPFFAANVHLREAVDFGGNFVVQTGWAWRGSADGGLFRAGVEYYNGENGQFSFFDDHENKVGLGLWYDY